jgi:hypothetical protein
MTDQTQPPVQDQQTALESRRDPKELSQPWVDPASAEVPGDFDDIVVDIMIKYRLPEHMARAFVLLDRGDVDVMGRLVVTDAEPKEEVRLPLPPRYLIEGAE